MSIKDILIGFTLGFIGSLLAAWAHGIIKNLFKRGRICSPADGSEVDQIPTFRGTCNLRGHYHLYLAVKPEGINMYYPQANEGPLINYANSWDGKAYIGLPIDRGKRFTVYLMAVDDEAKRIIDFYKEIGNETGRWFGFTQLPTKHRILAKIEVVRR